MATLEDWFNSLDDNAGGISIKETRTVAKINQRQILGDIVFNAPGEARKRQAKRKIAVIDFETDPFKYGRVPEPFCCEFYTDNITEQFWGEDCTEQLIRFLQAQEEPYLIYAHNGGKFDFHFLLPYVENPALIIKTRIVECRLFKHTLRDSFAILPVPLRDYEKMEFEYWKMERPVREKHKAHILEYLHSDCVNLYNLVFAFIERFGPRMTIGGTAMREIRKLHSFNNSGIKHDNLFRKFYYGGRVQCFNSGILPGPWKLFDVNSMYPAAMRNKKHPINGRFDLSDKMPSNFDMPFFVSFWGTNTNALPSVTESEDGEKLVFTKTEGLFHACSHELEIALEHELVKIDRIEEVLISTDAISFEAFVDKYFAEKTECKAAKDKTGELFAKLLLNSGYGRFGINPENFADWVIHRDFGNEDELEAQGYTKAADFDCIELWSRPTEVKDDDYCDVAVAASITSAARSTLLAGLQNAIEPIYCDTDSIICRDFTGDIDKYRLGAWDLEKESEYAAIAGKKMYALYAPSDLPKFNGIGKTHTSLLCSKCKLPFSDPHKHKAHKVNCGVKLSSKGGQLSLPDIIAICEGSSVSFENDAPTFSLKKPPTFVRREFRKTVDNAEAAQ